MNRLLDLFMAEKAVLEQYLSEGYYNDNDVVIVDKSETRFVSLLNNDTKASLRQVVWCKTLVSNGTSASIFDKEEVPFFVKYFIGDELSDYEYEVITFTAAAELRMAEIDQLIEMAQR